MAKSKTAATETATTDVAIINNAIQPEERSRPSWMIEVPNRKVPGELIWKPKFRYLEGMPREIRFDGRVGTFGEVEEGSDKTSKLEMKVVAFRFFEDQILGQKDRKRWVELFYIDKNNDLCAILFHTHTIRNLEAVIKPLFYKDMLLEDVVLTATSKKLESTKGDEKFTFYLAEFSIKEDDLEAVAERIDWADTVNIYRQQTITPNATIQTSLRYHNPYDQPRNIDQGGDEEFDQDETIDITHDAEPKGDDDNNDLPF